MSAEGPSLPSTNDMYEYDRIVYMFPPISPRSELPQRLPFQSRIGILYWYGISFFIYFYFTFPDSRKNFSDFFCFANSSHSKPGCKKLWMALDDYTDPMAELDWAMSWYDRE